MALYRVLYALVVDSGLNGFSFDFGADTHYTNYVKGGDPAGGVLCIRCIT